MTKITIEIDTELADEQSTQIAAKRVRPSLRSIPLIGIVANAKFRGTTLAQNFFTGLRNSGWEWDPSMPDGAHGRVDYDIREAPGDYGGAHHELNDAVHDFNANANVSVLVAVGGLPAAHAAATLSTKKSFLVLIGAIPTFNLDPHGKLRGGVNLNNPAEHIDRNRYLHNHYGVAQNRVCLLYNSNNTELSKIELQPWRYNHWPYEAGVSGDNDTSHFSQAFTNAQQNADAVVVSSDPFFTYARDDLVDAANQSGLIVCYPFAIYATTNPPPNAGSSMWYGPDLNASYQLMGGKTGDLLSDPTNWIPIDTANPGGPTYL